MKYIPGRDSDVYEVSEVFDTENSPRLDDITKADDEVEYKKIENPTIEI